MLSPAALLAPCPAGRSSLTRRARYAPYERSHLGGSCRLFGVSRQHLPGPQTPSIIVSSHGTRRPPPRGSVHAARPRAGEHLRRSITTRMVVASGAFALVIGALFVLLVFAIREQRDSAKRAIKAQEAISAGNKLEKLAIDLETGVRGYVASGANSVFLQPYTQARQAYPAQARELEALVSDNPEADAIGHRIQSSIDDYVNLYSVPMISLARDRIDVARSVIVNGTGPQRIDAIRRLFGDLFASERAVADKRTSQASSRANTAVLIGIGGLVLGLAAVAVLAVYLARSVVKPVREVAAGAERVAHGDLSARAPGQRA